MVLLLLYAAQFVKARLLQVDFCDRLLASRHGRLRVGSIPDGFGLLTELLVRLQVLVGLLDYVLSAGAATDTRQALSASLGG